jgi:hypothetical protein
MQNTLNINSEFHIALFVITDLTKKLHTYNVNGKVFPTTGHEGPEGEKSYSSTLSLTLALDVGGWSTPRPGRFTPGKETWYSLGGPQGRSGRVRKISPPPHRDSIPGRSSPKRVAIPTTLHRTHN